ARRVELVGFDPVDVDAAGLLTLPRRVVAAASRAAGAGARAEIQHGDRRFVEPERFFDERATRIVFAEQMAVFVVHELRAAAALLADALAPGVVRVARERDVARQRALFHAAARAVDVAVRAVAQRVAGGIVAARDAADLREAIAGGIGRVRRGRAAGGRAGAVAGGVVGEGFAQVERGAAHRG